jgi:hypothetical protein
MRNLLRSMNGFLSRLGKPGGVVAKHGGLWTR